MNGRGINLGSSSSDKKLIFNDIRYVKPIYLVKQDQKETRNLYYDNNPYFLNNNVLPSRGKGIYNTSRHSNTSRDLSQTSSQRSSKVIRANGLKIAEKPHFVKGTIPQRQTILAQSRNTEQTKKLFDRNIQLQEQNRILKQENHRLRENMRMMEEMHNREMSSLNMKFQALLKKTQQLQAQIQEDTEWKNREKHLSDIKTSNQSQFKSITNMNSGMLNITPKPNNYQMSRAMNGNQNFDRK